MTRASERVLGVLCIAVGAAAAATRLGARLEPDLSPGAVVALLAVLACAASLSAVEVALRLYARSAREVSIETCELVLGREDLAMPYQVAEAFEAVCGRLRARWYERLWRGQEHLVLELHRRAGGRAVFCVAGTPFVLRVFAAELESLYPDVSLRRFGARHEVPPEVVRLKKRRSFIFALATTKDYQHSFTESLVATLMSADGDAAVQIVLTPVPLWFQHRSRRLLVAHERSVNVRQRIDRADPGGESVVAAKEAKGALDVQQRALFWTELRVAACGMREAGAIAGVFDALRSENELVRRYVHVRRSLFRGRFASAMPNLIPGWRRAVLSSSELATLWQLPRGRAKHASLSRAAVRRSDASDTIARTADDALLCDGRGPVALWPEDRKYGLALVGGQGMGKSSVMARIALADAADARKALIVIDPKQDLARSLLEAMPEWRTVWYLDLGAPEIGLSPFAIGGDPESVASLLVQSLIEANPPGAIQAASDMFLRSAAAAVAAVEGRVGTLQHMYALLGASEGYRTRVGDALAELPELAFLSNYWSREFPALVGERRFAAERLDPPRNKLARLVSGLDVALRHPCLVDIEGVIARREILIVNGAKGEVGEDNARLFGQLVLQLVHRALQRRQRSSASERGPVSLCVDEAHNFLTPTVATLLAEGRSAGLEATFAWQYNAQVRDELVRSGLRSLLQSVCLFRMREVEDARSMAGLAMEVYADRIGVEQEIQERLRFSVDDVLRLPAYKALCLWVAHGVPQPAFVGETLPTPVASEQSAGSLAELHLEAQRTRGGRPLAWLPDPVSGARGSGDIDPLDSG